MTIYRLMEGLNQKINEQCRNIERKSIEQFIESIVATTDNRIFVNGVGRSGLVARAFAMRLMHLGFSVYCVGETITPAIHEGDLMICVSGSGETSSVVNGARIAKEKGGKVIAITSHPSSPLGTTASVVVQIKGRKLDDEMGRDYLTRQIVGEHEPLTPLGTLFELSSLVFLDSIVEELMRRLNKSEEHLRKFHTNLE